MHGLAGGDRADIGPAGRCGHLKTVSQVVAEGTGRYGIDSPHACSNPGRIRGETDYGRLAGDS